MKIEVLDITGKKIEDIELNEKVFGAKTNGTVLAQYLHVFRSNQRQGTSSAKTRAAVSGSGKKPWKQKGMGKARAGSIRSPIWRHGGIAHGPVPKSWNLLLPKKVKRAATVMALSDKLSQNQVKVLDSLNWKNPETKQMVELLKNFKAFGKTLLVLNENDVNVRKSASNINNLNTALAENLNAFELINAKNVIFLKDALVKVQEKYEDR